MFKANLFALVRRPSRSVPSMSSLKLIDFVCRHKIASRNRKSDNLIFFK